MPIYEGTFFLWRVSIHGYVHADPFADHFLFAPVERDKEVRRKPGRTRTGGESEKCRATARSRQSGVHCLWPELQSFNAKQLDVFLNGEWLAQLSAMWPRSRQARL